MLWGWGFFVCFSLDCETKQKGITSQWLKEPLWFVLLLNGTVLTTALYQRYLKTAKNVGSEFQNWGGSL